MKKEICGNTIETGLLQFECAKAYKHKGKHGLRWIARNCGKDPRMISVSWSVKP